MFTLAHISDLHLGPLPKAESWSSYFSKRAIGYLSWRLRRQKRTSTLMHRITSH
jgi:3',5'-cyclic AMP phosphodiesterase CpdA